MEENEIKEEQKENAAQDAANTETTAEETKAETKEVPTQKDKKHRRHNSETEQLNEKVQELGDKLAEMNDKYIRSVAEFDNYRKRTNQERADLILNGGKDVIKSILPIVDDLERALGAITDENAKEGVTMIYNKLMKTLEQKGLKPMDCIGQKFNEEFHEAITQIPAPTEEQKGTVLDVVEKGYFLNDKVLRYAKVVYAM